MNEATQLLQEGFVVMLIGVGIVFIFLVVTAIAMEINHAIIEKLNKIFPPEVVENKVVKKTRAALGKGKELIAAAIALAHTKQ